MTDEQLLKLADAITSGVVADKWWVHLLALALAAVMAAGTALLVEYFKTKGKNYATRADFDELLSQLRKTTTAQEEIKTAISHTDWLAREYLQLRRQKLEELLVTVDECGNWLDRMRLSWNESDIEVGVSPHPKVNMLSTLYFPEITEVEIFNQAFFNMQKITIEHKHKIAVTRANVDHIKAKVLSLFEAGNGAAATVENEKVKPAYDALIGAGDAGTKALVEAYPKFVESTARLRAQAAALMGVMLTKRPD